jgi:hypothetical protein
MVSGLFELVYELFREEKCLVMFFGMIGDGFEIFPC